MSEQFEYRIPPQKEKDKIIGGFLDFGQLGFLIAGLVAAGGVFFLTVNIFGAKGAIVFALFPVLAVLPFMFYKKEDMTLLTLIRYTIKHNQKNHYLPNIRTEREFAVPVDEEVEDMFVD